MITTYLLLKKQVVFVLFGLLPFIMLGQSPTGEIATWKNDAKGAYTIIHDDYGDPGVDGIWQYADTICFNRGIKFTFGAIANACESTRGINGFSNPYGYAKDVMMAQHNHEIISHSHTHDCAVGNAGWSPCDEGIGEAWGEDVNGANFQQQIREAHNSIENNTGFTPKYYIYPYDRFTNSANDTLKKMGYLGSRTGWNSPKVGNASFHRNGYENNDLDSYFPDADGFFRTSVQVFDAYDQSLSIEGQVAVLNNEVDNAIANSLWANRELHNVGDAGWGSVKVEAYRSHIDYLKKKVAAGDLWVGTVSEFLTYQMQKLKYEPNISYDQAADKVLVSWVGVNPQYNVNVSSYLKDLSVKSPITLIVNMDGLIGDWIVKQGANIIVDFWKDNGFMYINVYPSDGDIEIYKSGAQTNKRPYVDNSIADYTNLELNFSSFLIDLKNVFEDVVTDDINLIYTYSGNSSINLSITNGVATISSTNDWEGTELITFTVEDEEGLTISDEVYFTVVDLFAGQTPFGETPISIPGRIEAENYDYGGQGLSFNDVNTSYEPDPSNNAYRPNSDPDVERISGNDYGVGYVEDGEWLEYTIDVTESGWYNLFYNIAQPKNASNSPVGKITLLIDNKEWVGPTDMKYTASWTSYEEVEYTNAVYLAAGKHLLRIEFEVGNVNIDYLDILDSPTGVSIASSISDFKIFPNPSTSVLNLKGDFKEAIIFNQLGEVVTKTSATTINIANFHDGIYYVKFDNTSRAIKFVKTR